MGEHNFTPAGRRVPEDDALEMDGGSGRAGKGSLEELMQERIRVTIEALVDEESEAALGGWGGRRGWARFEQSIGTGSGNER